MIDWVLRWFTRTKFWRWFASTIIGHLDLRMWGYTTFPIEKYFEIVDAIQDSEREAPGLYFFSCSDPKSFAGWLISNATDSQTTHAGAFLAKPDVVSCEIVHMKGKGLLRWHLLQLLKEIDYLVISKYEFATKEERDTAYDGLLELMEKKPEYDYQQELGGDDLIYCSELIYFLMKGHLYLDLKGNGRIIRSYRKFNRDVFEPDHVWKEATCIVWSNLPGLEGIYGSFPKQRP